MRPEYVKSFQGGGIIDTSKLLEDVKKDPRFFKNNAYTRSGKERLAAIQEIADNQKAGITYKFDDSGSRFDLVDKSGKKVESQYGQGVGTSEKVHPLYGVFNKEKRSKKEVSTVLSSVAPKKDYTTNVNPATETNTNSSVTGGFKPEAENSRVNTFKEKLKKAKAVEDEKKTKVEAEPIYRKDKSIKTAVTPKETTTPIDEKNTNLNKDRAPENYDPAQSFIQREYAKVVENSDPLKIEERINKDKIVDPNNPMGIPLNALPTYEEELSNVNTAYERLNKDKAVSDWSTKQKSVLQLRQQELQEIINGIKEISKNPMNKSPMKNTNFIPKAQNGIKFNTKSSKEFLEKLKNSYSNQEELSEDDENNLSYEDKLEWNNFLKGNNTFSVGSADFKKSRNAQVGIAKEQKESTTGSQKIIDDKSGLVRQNESRKREKVDFSKGLGIMKDTLGAFQPNDLVQYLLARKAYKQPVATVRPNLLQFVDTGHRNVMAPRDIDYAMLKLAKNKIANIRSTYAGSDPIADMLSKQYAETNKAQAENELLMKRSDFRIQEENRAAAETEEARQQAAQNAQQMMSTYNTNRDRIYNADLQAAEAKKQNVATWLANLGAISTNIQGRYNNNATTRRQMEYEIAANERQAVIDAAKTKYTSLNDRLSEIEMRNKLYPENPTDTKALQEEINRAYEAYKTASAGTADFIRKNI